MSQKELNLGLGVCAVIGGNGFLGTNITQQLHNKGYKVRVIDIQSQINSELQSFDESNNIEYKKCDITNKYRVAIALGGVNTVFHTASVIDIRQSPSPMLYNVNVNGTKNIISYCNDTKHIRNLIYTSTIEVLNVKGIHDYKNAAEDQINPYNKPTLCAYSDTKAKAEQMVLENKNINSQLNVAAIRVGFIYGPNCANIQFATKIIKKFIPICSSPAGVMSSCYVENAAHAHIQIAEKLVKEPTGINGEVFHYKDDDLDPIKFMNEMSGVEDENEIWKVPYWFSISFAVIIDWIQYILHTFFGLLVFNAVSGLIVSSKMAAFDHVLNTDKFNKRIGYKPLFTRQKSRHLTKEWVSDQGFRNSELNGIISIIRMFRNALFSDEGCVFP